jgi:hypothetical protein
MSACQAEARLRIPACLFLAQADILLWHAAAGFYLPHGFPVMEPQR